MTFKRFAVLYLVALALVVLVASVAFAQSGAGGVALDWKPLLAMAINTVGVMLVTQLIKTGIPIIHSAVPWLLPILATLAGPVVAVLQSLLAGWVGVPIDLSPLLGLATGGAAVAMHQVHRQIVA
mgnify:FL=1